MKQTELIVLLREKGCFLESHGKRHDKWVSPEGNRFMIPRHASREVPPGTLDRILKDAGFKKGKK
jgi:predicted RNA binding protein YcfA (HicA-like mRNA interferase family)